MKMMDVITIVLKGFSLLGCVIVIGLVLLMVVDAVLKSVL